LYDPVPELTKSSYTLAEVTNLTPKRVRGEVKRHLGFLG
jgi:hypothetical protein